MNDGKSFKRHAGVRDGVHTHLVNTDRLTVAHGRLFDRLFETRLRLDYIVFASVDPVEARNLFGQAKELVAALRALVRTID